MMKETFVAAHLDLLRLEEDAEVVKNSSSYEKCSIRDLKLKGFCLLKLQVRALNSGMYGRQLVTFQHAQDENIDLPEHNLKSGDVVCIMEFGNSVLWENKIDGIITNIRRNSITVVVNLDTQIEIEKTYHVFRVSNGLTYKRMRSALKRLLKGKVTNSTNMVQVLFDEAKPTSINSSTLKLDFINPNLNDDQKEAVMLALCQKEIAVIHGPPGTGKTTTIVEAIMQMIKQGLKVLACAPSNVAADNLVECLAMHTRKIVRLSHPARSLPNCQQFNIDYLLTRTDNSSLVKDVEKEIEAVNKRLEANAYGFTKFKLMNEKHKLFTEKRERQNSMLCEVLQDADVIVSTLISSSCEGHLNCLPTDHFDVVIIDECSQALEAACWIPMINVKKCILAGDHNQLSPVIISDEAERLGLGKTLMERVLKLHGDDIKKLLTIQYRMHKTIMEWPSQQLYHGMLKAHESNANHLLCDLPNVEENENTTIPLLLIDTAGCDMFDFELTEDDSKGNEGEADLVAVYVQSLITSGLSTSDVAVITPYSLQVEIIRRRVHEKYPSVEVHSIDSFQGREKEAVILSFVRSNTEGFVGFLRNNSRINVAITRAKRHLAVICDSETVSHHPFLKEFVNYLQDKGEVRSACQYEHEISLLPSNEWLESKRCFLISHDSPRRGAKSSDGKDVEKTKNSSSAKKSENKTDSKKKDVSNKTTAPCEKHKKLCTELWQRECSKMLKESFIEPIKAFLKGSFVLLEFPADMDPVQCKVFEKIAVELNLQCQTQVQNNSLIFKKTNDNDDEGGDCMLLESSGKWSVTKRCTESPYVANNENSMSDSAHQDIGGENEECPLDTYPAAKAQPLQTSNINLSCPRPQPNSTRPKKQQPKVAATSKQLLKPMPLDKVELEEDFDSLIAAAIQQDNMCSFRKCKNNTSVLLLQCMHCKHRFCTGHIQYEVHGCGDAAKSHERAQVRKLGRVYPGSGKPQVVHSSAYRTVQLNHMMDKKLKELADKRKKKKDK